MSMNGWGCNLLKAEFFPIEVSARTMPTFAAIDIGSNSCRLKIATVDSIG